MIINAFKSHLPANVKVVATAFDGGDPSKTVDVAEQLLTAHPETNILFSWEGTAVAGISTAIKEKGKVGKVFGVVNDLTRRLLTVSAAGRSTAPAASTSATWPRRPSTCSSR